MDASCLRQGDIISGVPFPVIDADAAILGQIDPGFDVSVTRPLTVIPRTHRNQPNYITMQVKARVEPCIVLAHCCELELRHGKCRLPMITVGRIISVKQSIRQDAAKLVSLQSNKDPRNPEDPAVIDYFYLEPHDLIGGEGCVVDFSQTASIAGTEYESLIRRRVLQLKDRDRVKFKIKLATFLGRVTDDEERAGLENPWLAERASAATEGNT